MIQEEFSRLIYMYQEAAEGRGTSVEALFQKSLDFIADLKKVLVQGDDEDKKAAIRMMNELYQHMKTHTKIMCEKAGISEEQLIASSEDSSKFTPEQWRKMQESKKELAKAGQDLLELLQAQKAASPDALMSKPPAPKKGRKKNKAKKSQWMRS